MAFVTTAGGVYFEALLRSDTNGPLVVTEGGGADTYTLNLEAAPLADVTVSLSTDGQTELDTDEVVFTPSDWFNPKTVSVTAVDDAVAEGSHSGSISHTVTSPDSRFDGLPIGDVVADITDNDSTSVILSFEGAQNQVGEDGVTDSYTIALSTLPTDPVRVVLVANAQVTVDPSEVSFNAGNFDQPVTITVSAVDDSVDDDGVVGNIVHTVISDDPSYDGSSVSDATFEVLDNDAAGMELSEAELSLSEGGASGTYAVSILSRPTMNVVVDVAVGGAVTVEPPVLTFTPDGWMDAQTVSVTVIDDDIASSVVTETASHTVTSGDANYHGFSLGSVSIALAEDDEVGVVVNFDGSSLSVTEGGSSAAVRLRLNSEPLQSVTLALSVDDQLSVTPDNLVFDAVDWDVEQTVSITAVDDDEVEGDHGGMLTLAVESADGAYDALDSQMLSLLITDNDTSDDGSSNGNANGNSNDDSGGGNDNENPGSSGSS
ncbi:MAG: Calx-beta domain-containing protein, partial [Myxococcota bacterium]